jgi:hypothetical protein
LSHRQHFLKILGGSLLALILALGPLAIIAFPEMLDCLLIHHLNRPGGLDKAEIFWFFIRREWWLILLGLGGLALNRKNELVPPLVFVFAFLLFFKDLYYTYLGVLVPFLLIFGFLLLERLTSARRVCSLDLLIVVFIFGAASLILSSNAYGQIVFSHGRFLNASEIADFIAAQPEPFLLYGSHEVAPLVALFSERDLFGPHIDTNPQVFASGAANLEKVSREASRAGVFLLARITDLPEYGVTNQGFQGFFSQPVFDDSCQEVKAFPSTAQESDNYIKVFKCHAPD